MLAGLSVTVLLCGRFEQVYVLEEKKNLGFALPRLLFSPHFSVFFVIDGSKS